MIMFISLMIDVFFNPYYKGERLLEVNRSILRKVVMAELIGRLCAPPTYPNVSRRTWWKTAWLTSKH